MVLKLYSLAGCPYCRIVEDKLKDLGLKYEKVMIDSNDRPEIVKVLGGSVPVIVDGTIAMAESADIVRYLDEKYKAR